MKTQYGWLTGSLVTGATPVTKAAATGKQHILFGVSITVVAVGSGVRTLEVKDGDTIIWSMVVSSASAVGRDFLFTEGVAITPGNALSFSVSGNGTGTHTLGMHGITRG